MRPNPYGPYVRDELPDTIPQDEVVIYAPRFNTGKKRDATGAFHPEAILFCKHWRLNPATTIEYFDNRRSRYAIAEEVLSSMEQRQRAEKPIAVWGYFNHGYTHGMQIGLRSSGHRVFTEQDEENFERFLDIISEHPAPLVPLYACSTSDDPDGDPDSAPGSGDGSFADLTRDGLCERGSVYCRVFAHTTAGHTTGNPMIKMVDGLGTMDGGLGAELIAMPGTKEFKSLQRKLKTAFRFDVPFLTVDAIRKSL